MKLYLADSTVRNLRHVHTQAEFVGRTPRYLLSYYYWKRPSTREVLTEQMPGSDIMVDSGEFTAHNYGESIDVAAYADWLLEHQDLCTCYMNLDVKSDMNKGLRNQEYLESQGLNPIPIFHAGEPWEVLDWMLDKYNYVALGGTAGMGRGEASRFRFNIKAFEMAQGRAALHGLGVASWNTITQLPWYSVDASSWNSGFKFGNCPVIADGMPRPRNLPLYKPYLWERFRSDIEKNGLRFQSFTSRETYDRGDVARYSAQTYFHMEDRVTTHFGEIKLP